MLSLRANTKSGFTRGIGIGGIGGGMVYALQGSHELGRNESRLGELLDCRDYGKLHIVCHYLARLMGSCAGSDGFQVMPVGVVGDDATGRQLLNEMRETGIDARLVRTDPARQTLFSVCFMYPDGSGGNITSSNSAAATVNMDDLNAVLPYMKDAGAQGIALCVPEVPLELRREFLTLASKCGNYRVSSFVLGEIQEAQKMGMLSLTDLLALNQEEASLLFGNGGIPASDKSQVVDHAARFTADRPGLRLIISAGPKGAYGFECGGFQLCPSPVLQPKSTAGAGDALLAGVLCGLASGLPFITPGDCGGSFSGRTLRTALDLGILNASLSVTSAHTIHPETALDRLFAFAQSHGARVSESLLACVRRDGVERKEGNGEVALMRSLPEESRPVPGVIEK